MKKGFLLVSFIIVCTKIFCQDSLIQYQSKDLDSITVTAFNITNLLKKIPATITILDQKKLHQYLPNSFVAVINTIAGVRMEERSPNSYRLSIRGNVLRSPFGVRNIKVYWNDIPLTDAGGNTYLNLIELQHINNIEILKGPVASMYGIGTSGALLLKNQLSFSSTKKNSYKGIISGGSFGSINKNFQWNYQSKKFTSQLQQSYSSSSGYRQQSGFNKYTIQWNAQWQLNKHQLSLLSFYTRLYYQTPGGLTQLEFDANPTLARQATATLPSAIQQQTAIYNNTFFHGLKDVLQWKKNWRVQSSINNAFTQIKNPFITNYEKRAEVNLGARTSLIYEKNSTQWLTGAEWLYNKTFSTVFNNNNGIPTTQQYADNINVHQYFFFTQFKTQYKRSTIIAGISFNQQQYLYKRANNNIYGNYTLAKTKLIAMPRVSISYPINSSVNIYGIISKGFSPPSIQEIRPSDGNFYPNLSPEFGWNVEVGLKSKMLQNRLQLDIVAYRFLLQNAIVRNTNNAGSEYFVNAGNIIQQGIEASCNYTMLPYTPKGFITSFNCGISFIYQPHIFKNYSNTNTNYSSFSVTGVPRQVFTQNLEATFKQRFQLNILTNFTDKIPLTDANDAFSDSYQLVQFKTSYFLFKKYKSCQIFAGVDNVLNQQYSLGNDINATGKRYFNPAPERNYFIGLKF